jgi:cobalt-precorrin-6B (C15)-methyltransferase
MIKDNEFIKNPDVPGPTKKEIRCLVICKSQVNKEDVVVDIGCGTGGLTTEFARRAQKVYAVDKNREALQTTSENLEKHGLTDKVKLIEGFAPQAMEDIPEYDILIIGGSSGELPSIIKDGYRKLNDNGRIIVTSILLETASEAVSTFKDMDITPEVVNVNISEGKILKRGTMMTAQNPVIIISAEK